MALIVDVMVEVAEWSGVGWAGVEWSGERGVEWEGAGPSTAPVAPTLNLTRRSRRIPPDTSCPSGLGTDVSGSVCGLG